MRSPSAALVLFTTLIVSCTPVGHLPVQAPDPYRGIIYDISLVEVERPASARQRYGEQRIATVADTSVRGATAGVTQYSFEDALVRVVWIATESQLAFDLENKTDYSIKVVWDEAAFVSPSKSSSPVMHAGVKYNNCTSTKPPSVVVRHGRLSDTVVPCDNVHFRLSSWDVDPLMPDLIPYARQSEAARVIESANTRLKGTRVSVLLPLSIQDVVNEYVFTFEFQGAHMRY